MNTKHPIAVEVHDMTVSYDKKPVLWDIDLHLPRGKFIGMLGPNGVGKSTLLKAIMSVIPTDSGYVRFFNQPIHEVRQHISYVPQRQSVDWTFPALVEDIVMMGRYVHMGWWKRPRLRDRQVVAQSLQQVEMRPFAKRQIGALSVGQQQRVFLARAIAQEASILLLDEPLAGVDTTTSQLVLDLLQQLVKQGKTVIMIHHSLETAKQYFDYVVLLNMYVRGAGPAEEILTPQLLQETYGSQLSILTNISHVLHQKQLPTRET